MPPRIRTERPGDAPAIGHVHELATGGPIEAGIVDRLRGGQAWIPELSLVAEQDDEIAGHVLVSRAALVDPDGGEAPILALGPISVVPPVQRQGIGSALMWAAIEASRARNERLIVLLGHAEYYPRFGFGSARALGVLPPVDRWPERVWFALDLEPDGPPLRGRVRYPDAFEV